MPCEKNSNMCLKNVWHAVGKKQRHVWKKKINVYQKYVSGVCKKLITCIKKSRHVFAKKENKEKQKKTDKINTENKKKISWPNWF